MTVGPPGTGKTTRLVAKVQEAIEAWGAEKIMICSLTKAAAAEVKSRGLVLPKHAIGTIHSHCYRLLGHPVIAESKAKEFNEFQHAFPVDDNLSDTEGPSSSQKRGTVAYHKYTLARARMQPQEEWGIDTVEFAPLWEAWKAEKGYMDFEDLIANAHKHEKPPGNPWLIYVDECQDCSTSEVRLIKHWAKTAQVVLYGDTDQSLYQFRGGDPEAIMALDIPESNRIVLEQSHRVPEMVLREALRWIRKVKDRDDVVYNARPERGDVRRVFLPFKEPGMVLADANQYLKEGQTVMFLASCAYMLQPMAAVLRQRATPFCNPYQPDNSLWNPLSTKATRSLVAYLSAGKYVSGWRLEELAEWVDLISSEVLQRGAKKRVDTWVEMLKEKPGMEVTDEEVQSLFVSQEECMAALTGAWNGDLDWFEKNLVPSKAKPLDYPMRVYKNHGMKGLTDEPLIRLGTIHSTKGGQADVVYLSQNLSQAGYEAYQRDRTKDSVIRQFYVGMTRAYRVLVLCNQPGRLRVEW